MGQTKHTWFLRAVGLLCCVAGCIQTPSAAPHESGDALALQGVATAPDQTIAFYTLDRRGAEPPGSAPLERQVTDVIFGDQQPRIVPVVARSSHDPRRSASGRSLGIYDWSISLTTFELAGGWIPQDPVARSLATSPGRIEIAAYPVLPDGSTGARLFTQGVGQTVADDTFVAFDDDGVGLTAAAVVPWSGTVLPDVFIDSAGGGVTVEFGVYDVAGVPDPVRGVMCYPTSAGASPLRTAIVNHGGLDLGLTGFDLDYCVHMAATGWRVAMSAYRGRGVSRSGDTLGLPAELDAPDAPSVAESEFCLGEVTDVLRWTEVVRARADTRDDQLLMLGGSHGACITLRAVEQGAPVRAAVALAPPTEFADTYAAAVASMADPAPYIATWAPVFGGGTAGAPATGLQARSPARMAIDIVRRRDVHVLVAATIGDPVVSEDHSCLFASLAGTSNFLVSSTGGFVGTPPLPPSCAAVSSWGTSRPDIAGWPDRRYFLLYQAGATGPAIHVASSLFEPWDLTMAMMDSPIGSFLASMFGP